MWPSPASCEVGTLISPPASDEATVGEFLFVGDAATIVIPWTAKDSARRQLQVPCLERTIADFSRSVGHPWLIPQTRDRGLPLSRKTAGTSMETVDPNGFDRLILRIPAKMTLGMRRRMCIISSCSP